MTRLLCFVLFVLFANPLFAQTNTDETITPTDFNLGFESTKSSQSLPDNWTRFSLNKGYKVTSDSLVKHSGRRSMRMELSDTTGASRFASISATIPAIYEGKKIELRAWVKLEHVSDFMGLMLRIDNEDNDVLAFENLQQKRINGSKDWILYSVKLNLPKDAVTIFAGPILAGTGKLWIDDVQMLIDGQDLSVANKKPTMLPLKDRHLDTEVMLQQAGPLNLKMYRCTMKATAKVSHYFYYMATASPFTT
jgi:hypothetical protein